MRFNRLLSSIKCCVLVSIDVRGRTEVLGVAEVLAGGLREDLLGLLGLFLWWFQSC